MTTKTLIPELRFPEFNEEAAWELKTIGSLYEVTRGHVLAMTLVQEMQSDESPYPVYSSQTKHGGLSGYYSKYLYEDAITWTTDGANAGDTNFRKGKFFCTNVCGVLLSNEGYANDCMAQLINKVSRSHVSYVGNPKLMNGVMAGIKIPIPTKAEQQKIADCLGSLDELIAAHSRKLAALQDHKKGLLQQLFPAEAETTPKLRFPEFEDTGEWESDTLEAIFSFRQGLQVPVNQQFLDKDKNRTRFIRIIDVTQSDEPPRFIEVTAGAHILSKDNLFMIRYGTPGIVSIGYEGVIANNLFQLIIKNQKKQLPYFWFYYFQAIYDEISSLSGSSSMPAISFKALNNFGTKYTSVSEQQKIADCLSELDALITAQTEEITSLKGHKKGLMQQLFPNPDLKQS